MMTTRHPLATAWLDRVAILAADLPPGTRTELLVDLGGHLDEALAGVSDRAEVEAVLARLGDPADVVAAARESDASGAGPVHAVPRAAPPAAPEGLTGVEGLVLGVLVLVGLLSLVVLWLVGIVLGLPLLLVLWAGALVTAVLAGRWRGGEVVGLALLPVMWSLPVWAVVVPVRVAECVTDSTGVETCTGGGGSPLALVFVVAAVAAVVVATRWLARAPRGRASRR